MPSSKLTAAIAREVGKWQRLLTQKAYEYALSNPDPEAVQVSMGEKSLRRIIRIQTKREQQSAQRYSLMVIATGPAARAYEEGSGIHAEFERADYILIRPKKAKALVFFWQAARPFDQESIDMLPHDEAGRVVLGQVRHPGVKPANDGRGYIRPAVEFVVTKGREELKPSFRKAILEDISTAFKRGRKR